MTKNMSDTSVREVTDKLTGIKINTDEIVYIMEVYRCQRCGKEFVTYRSPFRANVTDKLGAKSEHRTMGHRCSSRRCGIASFVGVDLLTDDEAVRMRKLHDGEWNNECII